MKVTKMKRLYFDTNILNRLVKFSNYKEIFERLKDEKYKVCISEVTIFEVLRDQNDMEKVEKIIIMLQEANKISKIVILPSINQVIIDFIEGKESKTSKCYVINDVINNPEKTFVCSDDFSNYSIDFKKIIKIVKTTIKDLYFCEKCKKCENKYCEPKIINMTNMIIEIFLKENYYIFDEHTIQSYWANKNVLSNQDKDVAIKELNPLLVCEISPFRNMARMMISQKSSNMSNGVFCDALHILYFYYVDLYVSDDHHFKNILKNVIGFDEMLEQLNFERVG